MRISRGISDLNCDIPKEYFSGYPLNVFYEQWETDRDWLFSYATDEELERNRKSRDSA